MQIELLQHEVALDAPLYNRTSPESSVYEAGLSPRPRPVRQATRARRGLTMGLHRILRRLVGESIYARLQAYRRRRAERRCATQGMVQLRVGDFTLDAPSNHILLRLQPVQPYRDLAVGVTARELARKYPGATFVDIGANIGDTAALMATFAPRHPL